MYYFLYSTCKKEGFVTKALQKVGQTKLYWILHSSRRQLRQGHECFTLEMRSTYIVTVSTEGALVDSHGRQGLQQF